MITMPAHSHCIIFFIFLPDDWLTYIQSEPYRFREVLEGTENELSVQEHRLKPEGTSALFWHNLEKNRKTTIAKRRVNVVSKLHQYKCSCGRSFKQRKYLNYHTKWVCGKPPRFQCSECSYGTCNHSAIKIHMKRLHSIF